MRVKFFATYREITGVKETDIEAPPTVWDMMLLFGGRYGEPMRKKLFTPDGADIGEDAIILVNGRNVEHLKGKATPLSDADTVSIFPLVAGG